MEQNQLNRLQMVQFECPRVIHPLKSFNLRFIVGAHLSFVYERHLAPRLAGILFCRCRAGRVRKYIWWIKRFGEIHILKLRET